MSYKLTINNIVKETSDCVSIYFDIPKDIKSVFTFKSGQYITVIASINGESVRRSYSICTGTYEDKFGIAVKKIPEGKMSTYLNDSVKVGDKLEILAPEGTFALTANPSLHRDHYFVAAGSGITPVLSMIKEVVENEPQSSCYLYYGSRDEENIIFKAELDRLENRYKGQLTVVHTLSQPKRQKASGILGLLGKKNTLWKGEVGRIDIGKFINFLEICPSRSEQNEYYICGPGELIQMCETILKDRKIKEKHINREYFTIPDDMVTEVEGRSATMKAFHRGKEWDIEIKEGQTILQAMIDAGTDPQYSCTNGACSSCICKVTEGAAEMEVCFALDPDEVEDGYVLTCQAKPTTKHITVEYHEEESGWLSKYE